MTTKAAGILFLTPDNQALFLKRGPGGDHPGEWCWPGGTTEDGETAEQTAVRETKEELGFLPDGERAAWTRQIANNELAGPAGQAVNPPLPPGGAIVQPAAPVDYTTFIQRVPETFEPKLNGEHTGFAWAHVDTPPEPLHPGARIALSRLTMDELGVARAIAAGELTSPQRYGSFWLWAIRITGTGVAYRDIRNEWCYRPAEVYLNDEFLARCAGLPVIFVHPEKKPKLDSKEFNDRIVGTVFVPYLEGEDVWAVCRIYDEPTIEILLKEKFSTSPGVVFSANSGNRTLKAADGTTLLIEGKPALLDHIALVTAGVWDKGGPPTGVSTITEEPIGMTEEEKAAADKARKDSEAKLDAIMDSLKRVDSRMDAMEADKVRRDSEEKERADRAIHDAARKDRFGARKDGEPYKDWGKRHDADEEAMCDALEKGGVEKDRARKDAKDCRADAEATERKDGGESFEKWAKEESKEPEHKDARKDAEEKERMEREDRARHDAQTGKIADLERQLAAMNARFVPVTAEERDGLARAQSRADGVAGLFGKRASGPTPGETALEYRRRLAGEFKQHSTRFKDKSLASLDADMLGMVEEQIYADAASTARSPERAGVGVLIPIREQDEAGRTITRWTGDNMAWMSMFMSPGRVGKIIDPRGR